MTLDRLVDLNILEHHDGEFWTLSHAVGRRDIASGNGEGTAVEFVTSRIRNVIFNNEIPFPRDVIIVCLLNTCDVLRFIFQIDDELEKRVKAICQLDLIGRAIAEAVSHNLAGPLLQRSALTKKIPTVSLGKTLFNPHIRDGNIPALFADLAREYGPVFQISPPFKETMIFLAGTETNQWVQRRGRMYLRARDYFVDFEKVYGSSGVLPSLDGADHFPAAQVPVGGLFPQETGGAAGGILRVRAESHGGVEGRRILPGDGHEPADDQRSNLTVHDRS